MYKEKISQGFRKFKRIFNFGGNSKGDKKFRVHWRKTIGFPYSDAGVDRAPIYLATVNGYYIKLYPKKLIDRDLDGWAYEIINEPKNVDYDSAVADPSGRHPKTLEEAKKSALSKLEQIRRSH